MKSLHLFSKVKFDMSSINTGSKKKYSPKIRAWGSGVHPPTQGITPKFTKSFLYSFASNISTVMAKNELFAGRRYTFSNLVSICVSFSAFLGTMLPFWAHFRPKTEVKTYISCIYPELSRPEGSFNAH